MTVERAECGHSEADQVDTLEELAEHVGMTVLALKVFGSCGCPGGLGEQFALKAGSLAEFAKEWGVHRRTSYEWRDRGLPIEPDGRVDLHDAMEWANSLASPPKAMSHARKAMRGRRATGGALRAFLRVLRMEIMLAISGALDELLPELCPNLEEASDEELRQLSKRVVPIIATPFDHLCLNEHEIEKLVADLARVE